MDLGDFLSAEGYVGFQSQEYDDARLSANSGVYFGASVLWNITTLTSIRFKASRSVQETILADSSGFWDTQFSVSAEHELLENIILTAGAAYDPAEYKGISRQDMLVSGQLGLKWAFMQNYSLETTGEIQHRLSNEANNSFTRALIAVNLKASFEPR